MGQADFVIGDINMDGFQVVRGLHFSRMLEPSLKVWNTAISFNVPAYSALNNCESVQMLVNLEQRKILVKPVPSKEPDAINWIRDPAKPKTTKMECSLYKIFNDSLKQEKSMPDADASGIFFSFPTYP